MSTAQRLLGSSTFWTAVLSLIATLVGQHYGLDVPTSIAAVAPLAVGIKEAARRYGDAVLAAAMVGAPKRESTPAPTSTSYAESARQVGPSDLSQTAQVAAAAIMRAREQRERSRYAQPDP